MTSNSQAFRLFQPLRVGAWQLAHRVVMAPLTRLRSAQPGDVPTPLMARYYAQRATPGGLIISEATQISREAQGYPQAPGIYTDDQVRGWKLVTDAVHAEGGLIVLQLWHVGRISHSSFQPGGGPPVAPSPIAPRTGMAHTPTFERAPFETPRALETAEVPRVVADYARAAELAQTAGFDGVEIHAANGYLLDQFMRSASNRRTDAYGGSIENRCRIVEEVARAVVGVWGPQRVGIRFSPVSTPADDAEADLHDPDPVGVFSHALAAMDRLKLAYAHLVEAPSAHETSTGRVYHKTMQAGQMRSVSEIFRGVFRGPIIAAGGYARENAVDEVERGHADAIAFGRWFISNPDLVERLRRGVDLAAFDRTTFYGGGEAGYTDYARAT
ncbi:MAG: alkene reductase [Planctomycetota bacterium]|nr:alkene reductase [Planctomycetota bacterium]